MPLHYLCNNGNVEETNAMQILKLLLEKYPEGVRQFIHGNNGDEGRGYLPIHIAALTKSAEFCRVLVEAYPGSLQITDENDALALHHACYNNKISTIKMLHKLYPDAINQRTIESEKYPIHYAITGTTNRENPEAVVEIVQYLLDCDPGIKLQEIEGYSLFQVACVAEYDDSNIDAALEVIQVIFDAHPEAIKDNRIDTYIYYHDQVQDFIQEQQDYATVAEEPDFMTRRNDVGQLFLHKVIQNNLRLGSIKLLVKGNPTALQSPDDSGALLLHTACQHHDSTRVIQYLVGLDTTTLEAVDRTGNTALHYACRGAKYETIAILLDKYDAVSVSKQNAQKKLPIDLLWESNKVSERESIEYTESVYRLLKAYPEMVMNCNTRLQAKVDSCSSQNVKKRKLDVV